VARIACLEVPDLAVAAIVRMRPELRDAPIAVTDGRGARAPVIAASASARAAGIYDGMTAAQARLVHDGVVVCPYAPEAVRAAGNALADVAATFGPRVEMTDDGTVFLDCEGSAALCASEAELATILAARACRQGLAAFVGIASSRVTARIAARTGGGVRVVARVDEGAYLAPLPIALLEPDAATAATLASWGITSIGQLAALPAGQVAHRLGPAGARLVRIAYGDDDQPLRCRPTPTTIVEAVALEYGVDRLEPLLFLLRRLLDQLASRLALHGLACAELAVRLGLESGATVTWTIVAAAPTTDAKVLLTLVRAHLERQPPADAIVALDIAGTATHVRPTQLDFFQPNGPSAAALAATIARLAALCGPERVGRPIRIDTHRPDAVGVGNFCRDERAATDVAECGADGGPPPVAATRIALRAFRPPATIEVFESAGRLDYVRGPGFGGRVVHLAGPWRLRGEWWTSDPYAREYYDVELSDGALYRIFRDGRSRRWLADGMYD
jgi:protein ImuB